MGISQLEKRNTGMEKGNDYGIFFYRRRKKVSLSSKERIENNISKLLLENRVTKSMDKRQFAVSTDDLDFSNAFDVVSHDIPTCKTSLHIGLGINIVS